MKKWILLLLMALISTYAFAGGSIFGHKKRETNPDGVHSIGVFICANLRCPKVIFRDKSCKNVPHSTLRYGVCMCDSGYVMKAGQCVVDASANCTEIASCNSGYFCNFGGEGTPNVCQKATPETFQFNGTTYYYNKRADLSSWCRSTANDCADGYLTYYGAFDWCNALDARLLTQAEVSSLPQEWLQNLPWDAHQQAYWLDDGRILSDGTVASLGDTTGWQATGGVVCVKDVTFQSPGLSGGSSGWLEIADCDCTDEGVSSDITDELCNFQCCRNKYGEDGYAEGGICCRKNDDECLCNARCPGRTCVQGDQSTPLDSFCTYYFSQQ